MSDSCVLVEGRAARDVYRGLIGHSERQHRLLTVHWELTRRCNERCTHCYLDVLPPGAAVPDELGTGECLRVVDELAALGALYLTFSGGEALLRRDFFEIAEHARRRRFAVRLFSNGLALTPARADRLAALRVVNVELSVYGVDAATHEAITGVRGSFVRTLRAFDLLRARGVRTTLKAPLMHENWNQLAALRELATARGAAFKFDITIVPKPTGDRAPLAHRMSDDELRAILRATLSPLGSPASGENSTALQRRERFCGLGLTALALGPGGEVYSCVGARVPLGAVRRQPLAEIWAAPGWRELATMALPACDVCELRPYCYRCHGTAAWEDGSLTACSSAARREAQLRRAVLEELQAQPR